MIVPDGIVQAERLVTLAPAISRPLVLFDDDRRNAELAKARTKCDAALAAANNDDIGLLGVTEFAGFGLALFFPGPAVAVMAVFGAHGTAYAFRLFVTFQLAHRGQQGPDQSVLQADMAVSTRGRSLELKPAFGDATAFRGRLFTVLHKARRLDCGKLALEHVADLFAAFQRLQVPGEGYQIAPVAIGMKQVDGSIYVASFKRCAELGKNSVDFGGGTDVKHIHLLHWLLGSRGKRRSLPLPAY